MPPSLLLGIFLKIKKSSFKVLDSYTEVGSYLRIRRKNQILLLLLLFFCS